MKIIQTGRLILRPYTIHDFEELHSILSDKITMRFWPEPFSAEQTQSWIKRSVTSYKINRFGRLAVILIESKKLIGDCGIMLSEIDGKQENDLGYIFHHPYHGNGYGTEAAAACLSFAFNNLGLLRVSANMTVNNHTSIRVAEKIGMKKEKVFLNKRNRDLQTYLYSISK